MQLAYLVGRWACLLILIAAMADPESWRWVSLSLLLLVFVVVWGLCAAFTGNLHALPWLYRNAHPDSTDNAGPDNLPPVTIISTVRNEAVGIEAAVRSLAALDYPSLEMVVVDDHSTDETGQILHQLSSDLPQVRATEAPPLEAGWVGKNHAAWFGSRLASPPSEWLLFVDARVVLHPQTLRRAVAHAENGGLDFLSCLFFGKTGSLAEELMGPFQVCTLIVRALTPELIKLPEFPIGIGAFMLVRRNF